ncbi:MAG: cold shock domain-containing protein, partial [Actinobacteria bacterium]
MPPLGASGRTVAHGVVHSFDLDQGLGTIVRNGSGEEVFFHFTAIPGEGYRT